MLRTAVRVPVFSVIPVAVAVLAQGTKTFAQVPDAIAAAPAEAPMVTIHAEGAQIYDCKVDAAGKLTWQFREPIAALLIGGKTVGRHYAGPSWELADGSFVNAKVAGRAPGASAKDIPLLSVAPVNSLAHQPSRGSTIREVWLRECVTRRVLSWPCHTPRTTCFFRKAG
jgi:hypothetical protein